MLFISVLICVGLLGSLAQRTGLCMVRGVNEWKAGDKEFLLAILFSGVLAWVAATFSYYADIPLKFQTYSISGWIILGGLVFGFGTALNKACGVSTLSRLTRGDSRMASTILGWLVGWTILADWSPKIELAKVAMSDTTNYLLLIFSSIAITVWALFGDKKRKVTWFGMMGIGLLSGFIYLYQPKWPPSGLLRQLSRALIDDGVTSWPSLEQYVLFIALLLGMFIAAWRTKRFIFVSSNVIHWVEHLFAGMLMGIGASIAMGGNSVQLLLALPTFSPSGFGAIAGMLIGIWCGLYVRERYKIFD